MKFIWCNKSFLVLYVFCGIDLSFLTDIKSSNTIVALIGISPWHFYQSDWFAYTHLKNVMKLLLWSSQSYATIIINFIFVQLNPSIFQTANSTSAITSKTIRTMIRINHQVSLQVPTVRASTSQYDTALQLSFKVVQTSPWSLASLFSLDAGDPKFVPKF